MMDWDVDMEDAIVDGASPPTERTDGNQNPDPTNAKRGRPAEGDPDSPTIVPEKIHIRGVDTFSTDDIKAYVKNLYGSVGRVEWINDESANLIFASEAASQEALLALSAVAIADITSLPPLELIPAKTYSPKPEANLEIRPAVLTDKKAPGAAAKSRYYLLNPDQDPEERRRRQQERQYRDRDYKATRRNERRSSDDRVETFEATMYDDDEAALEDREAKSHGRRESRTELAGVAKGDRNLNKELFPTRSRNRSRSASPLGGRSGEAHMDSKDLRPGTSRNRQRASNLKDRLAGDRERKELFPKRDLSSGGHLDRLDLVEETSRLVRHNLSVDSEQSDSAGTLQIKGAAAQKGTQTGFTIKGAASVTELFPDKFGTNQGRELFAEKLGGRSRPRKRAEDLFS